MNTTFIMLVAHSFLFSKRYQWPCQPCIHYSTHDYGMSHPSLENFLLILGVCRLIDGVDVLHWLSAVLRVACAWPLWRWLQRSQGLPITLHQCMFWMLQLRIPPKWTNRFAKLITQLLSDFSSWCTCLLLVMHWLGARQAGYTRRNSIHKVNHAPWRVFFACR